MDGRRYTQSTVAGLEDAMACLVSVELALEVLHERVDNAKWILSATRQGPNEYDKERPAIRTAGIR
jgi:hypothetical protein